MFVVEKFVMKRLGARFDTAMTWFLARELSYCIPYPEYYMFSGSPDDEAKLIELIPADMYQKYEDEQQQKQQENNHERQRQIKLRKWQQYQRNKLSPSNSTIEEQCSPARGR